MRRASELLRTGRVRDGFSAENILAKKIIRLPQRLESVFGIDDAKFSCATRGSSVAAPVNDPERAERRFCDTVATFGAVDLDKKLIVYFSFRFRLSLLFRTAFEPPRS